MKQDSTLIARAGTRPRSQSGNRSGARPPSRGLRIAAWPLFGALAVLHLVVLPLVVAGHDAILLVAGVAYLALAAADALSHRRGSARKA